MLFLELRKDGLRNCSPNNCDDRGAEVTATVRRLLIDVADLDKVIAATSGAAATYLGADLTERLAPARPADAALRRAQHRPGEHRRRCSARSRPPSARTSWSPRTARRAHRALRRVQAAGRRRVPDTTRSPPSRNRVRLPRRDPGDDRAGPLHAVLLGPVRRPARRLRRAALEGRRPDVRVLPARGPLPAPPDGGRARPGPPTTPPTTATGSCRRPRSATARTAPARSAALPPARRDRGRASPRRLRTRASGPRRAGGATRRCRPRRSPTTTTRTARRRCSSCGTRCKTARGRANQNLSYRADEYAPAPPAFVTDPLRFDLEPNNFLRIEGHLGKNVQSVLEVAALAEEEPPAADRGRSRCAPGRSTRTSRST